MEKAPGRFMVFMSKRMIACDEASYLISFREDQRLGFRRWVQLRMHLLGCHLCRKYAKQIGELTRSMAVYRDGCSHNGCVHRLSPEAGSRIGEELQRELKAK
jgi:hypothetical protein